jgi:hypothetical protein
MVTLAIYTLNFFHPGIWLNKADPTSTQASQQEADEEAATWLLMQLLHAYLDSAHL